MAEGLYYAREDTKKQWGFDLENADISPLVPPGRKYIVDWRKASISTRRKRVQHFVIYMKQQQQQQQQSAKTKANKTAEVTSKTVDGGGIFKEIWFQELCLSNPEAAGKIFAAVHEAAIVNSHQATSTKDSPNDSFFQEVRDILKEVAVSQDTATKNLNTLQAAVDSVTKRVGCLHGDLEDLKTKYQADFENLLKRIEEKEGSRSD